jgi:hypothetical protein
MVRRWTLLAACTVALLAAAAPASAAVTNPIRATGFIDSVGVNVHMSYFSTGYDRWQKVRDKLVELGVRHVRDGACAGCTEQRQRLLALHAAGIGVDYIMGRPGDSLGPLVNMLAGPMRSTVDAVEGPNEYDQSGAHSWAKRLRRYQRRLYRLVKRTPTLKSVPVLAPSLVREDDFRRLGNLSHFANYGNIHPYSGGEVPASTLGFNRHVEQRVARKRPVVATEAGFHNALRSPAGIRPVSEAAQAAYVPRLFLDFFRAGVTRTYLYELLDERPNRSRRNAQKHFGLLRANFSEKPAFRTLRALLSSVAPTTTAAFPLLPLNYEVGASAPGDLRQVLLQTGPRTWALILWRNVSVWNPNTLRPRHVRPASVQVLLHDGARAFAVRDLRHHPAAASGPVVRLRLTGMPKVISITR